MSDVLDKIDFARLLVQIGFTDVNPNAKDYLGFCLFHNDQATKSFSANLHLKLYNCFGCGIRGNAIQLYAKWKNISVKQAMDELVELPDLRSSEYLDAQLVTRKPIATWLRMQIYTDFVRQSPPATTDPEVKGYLNSRGLSDNLLNYYRIRSYKGKWKDCPYSQEQLVGAGVLDETKDGYIRDRFDNHRIIFPYMFGEQVTYIQGRVVGKCPPDRPKYLGVRGDLTYAFNYNAVTPEGGEALYICEGAMDALSLIELGYIHTIGIPGVESFKPYWLDDIKFRTVHLALDNDRAGLAGFEKISKLFASKGITTLRFSLPSQFKDINEWLCSKQAKPLV